MAPQWRRLGLERRLLGRLGDELAHHGPTEVITLTYHGPEAEYLRRLGFHSRVTTLAMLTIRPVR